MIVIREAGGICLYRPLFIILDISRLICRQNVALSSFYWDNANIKVAPCRYICYMLIINIQIIIRYYRRFTGEDGRLLLWTCGTLLLVLGEVVLLEGLDLRTLKVEGKLLHLLVVFVPTCMHQSVHS